MWLEKYKALSSADKERFTRIVNQLLNRSYILREIHEQKDRIGKINGDYRFFERCYEIFCGYLKIAGYTVEKDDTYGVISISSIYEYNKAKVDKFTTLVLFTLRSIYDDEKEKNANRAAVFCKISNLVQHMIESKIVNKKPTIKDTVDALRLIARHNIIGRLDGPFEDFNSTIVIYPTILFAVSNEKVSAIYSMIFNDNVEVEKVDEDFLNLN